MAFTTLLSVAYFAITALGLTAFWRYRRASPIFWHQAALALMAFGTFSSVNQHLPSDRVYVTLIIVAHVTFLAVAVTVAGATKLSRAFHEFVRKPQTPPSDDAVLLCVLLLLISAAVTIAYYYALGYNVLVQILEGNVSYSNYSDLRLDAYSGDEYFAPGYVNQFKNVLLPLTALILGLRLFEKRQYGLLRIYIPVAVPLLLIALAGTGQRAFIIYTIAASAFGYFLHLTGFGRSVKWRYIVLGGLILVPVFLGMTAIYLDTASLSEMVGTAISRFTSVQQEGGLFGFQYIYQLPITWFHEWWLNLVGILPGVAGSTIDHDIHAALYGSERGTVPLTTVGSAYYNAGLLGVIILFSVLGVFYTLIYVRYLRGPRTYTRSYAYGFIFFYLSIYVADSPTILLDNGVLTCVIFLWLLRRAEELSRVRRAQKAT
jgi:oligosaccharide repeat unit polymerase